MGIAEAVMEDNYIGLEEINLLDGLKEIAAGAPEDS